MSRHTPGPWSMVESDSRTGWMIGPGDTDGQDYVADVHKLVRGRSDEDSEANARLIAAAPDLIAACEAAMPHHQGGHSFVGCMLHAAISKARGVK